MTKYIIDSILCTDGEFHKVNYAEFNSTIDKSQIRGGYGNVPKPINKIELLLTELKARYNG